MSDYVVHFTKDYKGKDASGPVQVETKFQRFSAQFQTKFTRRSNRIPMKPSYEVLAKRSRALMEAAHSPAIDYRLGDPSSERAALTEWRGRVPPQPQGTIPVHPRTDGAAILARVLNEPIDDAEDEE